MMRQYRWYGTVVSLVSVFVCFFAAIGSAYFLDYNIGTRPTGLGGAFVAVADDANTMNWNPAGLAGINRYEITTMFASLFSGYEGRLFTGARDAIGYNYVAVAVPLVPEIGSFGVSWAHLNSTLYFENTFNLGYARTIMLWWQPIHVGASMKILNWSTEGTDYAPAFSKTGFTGDLGVLCPLPANFSIGMNVENIIPTDVGETIYEEVPRNFRVGASWKQDLSSLDSVVEDVLMSVEVVNRSYMQNKNTVRFGVESWFFDGLAAARTGINSQEFSFSLSGRYTFEQLNNTQLQLDYSFSLPFYIQKTYGSHRVALTASWERLGSKKARTERAELELLKALQQDDEENMAKLRDQQLQKSRAQEEAALREMERELREGIQSSREALFKIEEEIKKGTLSKVGFEERKSIIRPESFPAIQKIGEVMKTHPKIKFRVMGHTDSVGKPVEDIKLSQARARAVREYWITRYGIDPKNIIIVGYGSTHPLADNDTKSGRETNQRIEVKALSPAGMSFQEQKLDKEKLETDTTVSQEPIQPEDVVRYEALDELKEKLEVYQMQMDTDEVEEMFQQQHQENK